MARCAAQALPRRVMSTTLSYAATFTKTTAHLSSGVVFGATAAAGVVGLCGLPIAGRAWTDWEDGGSCASAACGISRRRIPPSL